MSDELHDLAEELGSYVYFIAAGDVAVDGTPVKIGVAVDPHDRLSDLQPAHHAVLSICAAFPGGRQLERKLHAACERDHIRGEWFASSPALRALIADLRSRIDAAVAASQRPAASGAMGAGGFEPPLPASPAQEPGRHQPAAVARVRAARAAARALAALEADADVEAPVEPDEGPPRTSA